MKGEIEISHPDGDWNEYGNELVSITLDGILLNYWCIICDAALFLVGW